LYWIVQSQGSVPLFRQVICFTFRTLVPDGAARMSVVVAVCTFVFWRPSPAIVNVAE